jgi:vacuolar iron transporter family protein
MENRERHRTRRIGWLRAAVLGANDGIVSTAILVLGVAGAESNRQQILVAGIAGLVAGALSMAAGEYVSVSSQADTERADLTLEQTELATQPQAEEDELTAIYVRRGVEPDVARAVARQLMVKDALGAHSRDELGLTQELGARPLQAALASAATFAVGAGLPILTIVITPTTRVTLTVSVVSLLCLAALGAVGAHVGGAPAISVPVGLHFGVRSRWRQPSVLGSCSERQLADADATSPMDSSDGGRRFRRCVRLRRRSDTSGRFLLPPVLPLRRGVCNVLRAAH